MVSKNNPVPQSQFRKHWQKRVKVRFSDPAKKKQRKEARQTKAASITPRPLSTLRPVVRPPTARHNFRVRYGRGFTAEELKAANVPILLAPTIGIAVDQRRRNYSKEAFDANVQRLKEYQTKLVLFPRNAKKPKTKGAVPDASADKVAAAKQIKTDVLPLAKSKAAVEWKEVKQPEKSVVSSVRRARGSIRAVGFNIKKKNAAAVEGEAKPKKAESDE